MSQSERTAGLGSHHQMARRTVELSLIVLGVAVFFVVLWYVADAFLLIFAGVLVAGLLDAGITGLGRVVDLDRRLRFALVLLLFAAAVAAFLATWGVLAVQQLSGLISTLESELQRWRSSLVDMGFGPLLGESGEGIARMLPDPAGLVTQATTAITGVFGLVGSGVIIMLLGVFIAYNPQSYREGVLRLFPIGTRARLRQVVAEAGTALRWWLVGIAINMVVIAVFTTLGLMLIGVPHAIVLGVQAGLFAFIPNIGPVLAAIPILLVALAQDYTTLFWALALYGAVQMLESNVLTPLVQMEMVLLRPGTILVVQLIMAALFGATGLALATPLTAVGKVIVERLYVEDWLGDAPYDKG